MQSFVPAFSELFPGASCLLSGSVPFALMFVRFSRKMVTPGAAYHLRPPHFCFSFPPDSSPRSRCFFLSMLHIDMRMMRRIVSCETPYDERSSASVEWKDRIWGVFDPGRRLLTIGGGLTSYAPSWASTSWTLRYSLPAGARKRYKIGDSVVETRRFR